MNITNNFISFFIVFTICLNCCYVMIESYKIINNEEIAENNYVKRVVQHHYIVGFKFRRSRGHPFCNKPQSYREQLCSFVASAFYRRPRRFQPNTYRNAACTKITITYIFVKNVLASTANALECYKRSSDQLLFYLIRAKERTAFYIITQERTYYRIMGKIEDFNFNGPVSKHYADYSKAKIIDISDLSELSDVVEVNENNLDSVEEYYNIDPSTSADANVDATTISTADANTDTEEFYEIDVAARSHNADAYSDTSAYTEYSGYPETDVGTHSGNADAYSGASANVEYSQYLENYDPINSPYKRSP